MAGKAIMAAAEGRNRCLDGRREGGGWRVEGTSPGAPNAARHDSVRAEQRGGINLSISL